MIFLAITAHLCGETVRHTIPDETMEVVKTAPTEVAPSRRDLTKSAPEPAMTREVSMATPNGIGNHSFSERVLALPPGEWVTVRGIRRFVPAAPVVEIPAPRKIKHVAKCGTAAGYTRHKRLGEDVCDPCRDACREKTRARRARLRAAAQNLTEEMAA